MTTDGNEALRRALDAIGNATDPPRPFHRLPTDLPVAPQRNGRPRWPILGAAALLAAAVVAVIALRPGGGPGNISSAPDSTGSPVTTIDGPPASASATNPPDERGPWPLGTIVAPLLPQGFTIVSDGSDPERVTALDTDGVRIDVTVDLDGARHVPRGMYDDDAWIQSPQGEALRDGSQILTTAGDVVTTQVSYADQQADWPFEADAQAAIPSITSAVAASLNDVVRAQIRDREPATVGMTNIVATLDELMKTWGDGEINGYGGGTHARDEFNHSVQWGVPDTVRSITISAIHTTAPLPDAITRPEPRAVTGFRAIDDWQLLLWAYGPADTPLDITDADVSEMLDDVAELVLNWTPPENATPVCTTHAVAVGESLASIADRYGVTLDELIAVNPDHATLRPDDAVAIPCTTTGSPTRSDDTTGLDNYPTGASMPSQAFTASASVTIASDLIVWVVTGGTDTNTGLGMSHITRHRRDTGEQTSESLLTYQGCVGTITIADHPDAPLDAIPVTCSSGTTGHLDLFSGAIPELAG